MESNHSDHRKVYAKGYFDGVAAAEGSMTPSRYQANLNGQTSVARKVFELVPIKEAWTPIEIVAALNRATKSSMDFKVLTGCLNTLKESGLVREPTRGHFQRVEVKEKEERMVDFNARPIVTPKSPVSAAAPAPAPAAKSPIEILSEISGRLVGVNAEIKRIASDIETAALVIEEGMAANEENLGKLRQLQSILKSLS